ncbi:alkaline phosphatase D family protein [Cognataquiflexum rubidum]|uniref:alkaline phosphatase D family protein n=1 Tax=Cognataquiflexum rubidum TaxID=2922273 RepID=UPI001F1491E1|nr:alkaline phosphatase D family protein [Cognataquiflexum rubidum]MCH6236009.1 alkaline phosphatase family protein [Cognataquiflexum rubidum]
MNKYLPIRDLAVLLSLFLVFSCSPYQVNQGSSDEQAVSIQTIAFGSCNRQNVEQPLWNPIIANKPDLWIWLGDNIYGDTDSMAVLKAKYNLQNAHPEYQKLKTNTPIIGIWDDHDYGRNDAGKGYPYRKESRDLMFDFLDIPQESPLRQKEGAYGSYEFGTDDKKIKVILLDARYFRDTLAKQGKDYIQNDTGTILGEEQWNWLAEELKNNSAKITLIGSGIQILSAEHPYEKWANFPKERERLLKLLETYKVTGAILLSGDRHIAEISKTDIPGISHPVYDVTSSGLTHTWKEYKFEPNTYRVGDLIAKLNFGLIHLDWQKDGVKVDLEIRGEADSLYLKESFLRKF